jgi:hypothetical protein
MIFHLTTDQPTPADALPKKHLSHAIKLGLFMDISSRAMDFVAKNIFMANLFFHLPVVCTRGLDKGTLPQ